MTNFARCSGLSKLHLFVFAGAIPGENLPPGPFSNAYNVSEEKRCSEQLPHPGWTQVCDGNICMLEMPSMTRHTEGLLWHKVLSGQHDSSAKSFLAVPLLGTALPCAGTFLFLLSCLCCLCTHTLLQLGHDEGAMGCLKSLLYSPQGPQGKNRGLHAPWHLTTSGSKGTPA